MWESLTLGDRSPNVGVTLRRCPTITTTIRTDNATNQASTSIDVTIDTTPPELAIASPVDGAVIEESNVTVIVSAVDAISGVASVVVNGVTTILNEQTGNYEATLENLPDGPVTITAVATDNIGNSGEISIAITVVTNQAPTANAGPDQPEVEATGTLTSVTLNGSNSSDPDEDILTFVWTDGGAEVDTGVEISLNLPLGTHTFTLTVSDGAESASDDVVVTIQDTTPPLITAIEYPAEIACSPEGETFTISVTAEDLVSLPENLIYTWSVDGVLLEGTNGSTAEVTLVELGDHTVVVTVKDGAENVSDPNSGDPSGTFIISTVDQTAPEITADLIPVRKKYYYEVNVEAGDDCDLNPSISAVIYQPLKELGDDVELHGAAESEFVHGDDYNSAQSSAMRGR